MNDKTVELLNKLAAVLGSGAQGIVDAYTWSFIATSVVWFFFGVILLGVAVWYNYAVRKNKNYDPDDMDQFMTAWLPTVIVGFLAMLIIFDQLADLSAPRAAAIHQLLKDITAK